MLLFVFTGLIQFFYDKFSQILPKPTWTSGNLEHSVLVNPKV